MLVEFQVGRPAKKFLEESLAGAFRWPGTDAWEAPAASREMAAEREDRGGL